MAETATPGAGHRAVVRFPSGKQITVFLPGAEGGMLDALSAVQHLIRYDEPGVTSVNVELVDV